MTASVLLAYNPNDVRPGWVALVLVLVLIAVTYLLWRSMNTQLGRIQMRSGRPPDTRIPGLAPDPVDVPGTAPGGDPTGEPTPPPVSDDATGEPPPARPSP